ncbi:hypothetical protein [Sorangium sp. So ce1099]|uniref:hypothetical protein n=1 Tax=Sorangium sp. So ce1099 TaxID=3133331 RepID=UPI003F5F6828
MPVLDAVAVRQAAKYHERGPAPESRRPDPLAHVARRVPSPYGEVEARALLELF